MKNPFKNLFKYIYPDITPKITPPRTSTKRINPLNTSINNVEIFNLQKNLLSETRKIRQYYDLKQHKYSKHHNQSHNSHEKIHDFFDKGYHMLAFGTYAMAILYGTIQLGIYRHKQRDEIVQEVYPEPDNPNDVSNIDNSYNAPSLLKESVNSIIHILNHRNDFGPEYLLVYSQEDKGINKGMGKYDYSLQALKQIFDNKSEEGKTIWEFSGNNDKFEYDLKKLAYSLKCPENNIIDVTKKQIDKFFNDNFVDYKSMVKYISGQLTKRYGGLIIKCVKSPEIIEKVKEILPDNVFRKAKFKVIFTSGKKEVIEYAQTNNIKTFNLAKSFSLNDSTIFLGYNISEKIALTQLWSEDGILEGNFRYFAQTSAYLKRHPKDFDWYIDHFDQTHKSNNEKSEIGNQIFEISCESAIKSFKHRKYIKDRQTLELFFDIAAPRNSGQVAVKISTIFEDLSKKFKLVSDVEKSILNKEINETIGILGQDYNLLRFSAKENAIYPLLSGHQQENRKNFKNINTYSR